MPEEKIVKKVDLTITELRERQPVGDKGAIKLAFKAKMDDKELQFFTFSKRLFETIEKSQGKVLSCDVEFSSREIDGNTFFDRRVQEIYVEGKPMGGGFQPQYRQDSPETRASIEAQTAFNGVIELLVGKVIDSKSELGQKALQWAFQKLGNLPNSPIEVASQIKVKPKTLPQVTTSTLEASTTFPKGFTTQDLFARVAEAKGFTSEKIVRPFLVNACKIAEKRLDTEPEKVWEEVRQKL